MDGAVVIVEAGTKVFSGGNMLNKLSIGRNFILLGTLAILAMISMIGLSLKDSYDLALEQKRLSVRYLSEAAASTMRAYAERARRGELSQAEAQKLALDSLANARFDDGNYFFVYNFHGVILEH